MCDGAILGQSAPLPQPDDDANQSLFQWHLGSLRPGAGDIRAVQAWNISRGSPDVVIAVLDTGVDPDHPALAHKLLPGRTFVDGTYTTADDMGHGTEMAGAAAGGGPEVWGVCPEARLLPVKVANAHGHTVDASVAEGLRWAVDQGVRVINISLGTRNLLKMQEAVRYAAARDVVVVAAAGNSGSNEPPFPAPAMYPEVLAVGGSNRHGQRWVESSWGQHNLVLAPAEEIVTSRRGGGWVAGGCTSISAAQVSGLAALVRSVRPDLSALQVVSLIKEGAERLIDSRSGSGRINCYATVRLALES